MKTSTSKSKRWSSKLSTTLVLLLLGGASTLEGGVFNFDSSIFSNEDSIVHPVRYVGTADHQQVVISVCLDPSTSLPGASLDEIEVDIDRVIETWNNLIPMTGNFFLTGGEPGKFDFASVLLHELGHCAFGLDHPNHHASISDPPFADFFTAAREGDNGAFDLNSGPDGVQGTHDDLRGDDVNIFWFDIATNNPFTMDATVDGTTYSRDLLKLPATHTFPANSSLLLGASMVPSVDDTQAAMFSGLAMEDIQTDLGHDDVAMVRIGQSGKDLVEGTTDDYTVVLEYAGRFPPDSSNCDVAISSSVLALGLGACDVSSITIGNNHFRLAGIAQLYFNPFKDWGSRYIFFDRFEDGNLSAWSSSVP